MGTTNNIVAVRVLEQCQVSPPQGAVADTSLPLTFFDMKWLVVPPVSRLLFFDSPNSKTKFIQSFIPNLKNALSSTLRHYFPFAGNSIIPSSTSASPEIRYINGDSVTLTVVEYTDSSTEMFNHLTGYHPRDVDELLSLVPQLPPATTTKEGCLVSPLFAVQVTLFTNHGVAVGFTASHIVADGKSIWNFIQAWALYSKHENDDAVTFPIPLYDRSLIKDVKGIGSILWSQYLERRRKQQHEIIPQSHLVASQAAVQATVVMHRVNIHKLKNSVLTKLPKLAPLSSFTVVCAYIWVCMAKASVALEQEVDNKNEDEEDFVFVMDCRARLDPPIPDAYFGNCLAGCRATQKSIKLLGEDGIVAAAQAIAEAIHSRINNEEGGVLRGADMWYTTFETVARRQKVSSVAGSPKFEYYKTDFGWGKPVKVEALSQRCSLISEGDVEIGVCFSKNLVEAFTRIFANGLAKVTP